MSTENCRIKATVSRGRKKKRRKEKKQRRDTPFSRGARERERERMRRGITEEGESSGGAGIPKVCHFVDGEKYFRQRSSTRFLVRS